MSSLTNFKLPSQPSLSKSQLFLNIRMSTLKLTIPPQLCIPHFDLITHSLVTMLPSSTSEYAKESNKEILIEWRSMRYSNLEDTIYYHGFLHHPLTCDHALILHYTMDSFIHQNALQSKSFS